MAIDYRLVVAETLKAASCETATRKLYLSYPNSVFKDLEDIEFSLFERMRLHLSVPFSSIKIIGSAKTGFSAFKKHDFDPLRSDIDVAIIDANLFVRCMDLGLSITEGKYAPIHFPMYRGENTRSQYIKNLGRGMIRPELMPLGPDRQSWLNFLGTISAEFMKYASEITVAIYISEAAFIQKQTDTVMKINLDSGIAK